MKYFLENYDFAKEIQTIIKEMGSGFKYLPTYYRFHT